MRLDEDDLRHLLGEAGQTDATLGGQLAPRLRRRQRQRQVTRGAILAGIALVSITVVPTVTPPSAPERVELAASGRQEAFDADVAVSDALPPVPPAMRPFQPTVMPAGTQRCSVPERRGEVTRTTYCTQGPGLTLETGPHYALPEDGDIVVVGSRHGYVQRGTDRVSLTVSDANSLDDTHLRYTVFDPRVDVGDLVEVMVSIPAIAAAPPPGAPAD